MSHYVTQYFIKLLVETDLASAFQKASREDMLEALWEVAEFRDFIPFFMSLYDGDAKLFVADFGTLLSEWGCHQGCPLGTFLFVISIASIVEQVIEKYPTVTIVGFADDYRFIGPTDAALDAAAEYAKLVTAAEHTMQKAKSNMFSFSEESIAHAEAHPYGAEEDDNRRGERLLAVA